MFFQDFFKLKKAKKNQQLILKSRYNLKTIYLIKKTFSSKADCKSKFAFNIYFFVHIFNIFQQLIRLIFFFKKSYPNQILYNMSFSFLKQIKKIINLKYVYWEFNFPFKVSERKFSKISQL